MRHLSLITLLDAVPESGKNQAYFTCSTFTAENFAVRISAAGNDKCLVSQEFCCCPCLSLYSSLPSPHRLRSLSCPLHGRGFSKLSTTPVLRPSPATPTLWHAPSSTRALSLTPRRSSAWFWFSNAA